MEGPFELQDIDEHVEDGSCGVYLLGRYGDHPRYVGRSDTCRIRSEILDAAYNRGRRYLRFWFEYCTSPMKAYKGECAYYHSLGGDEGLLDNHYHPARPWYTHWKCPCDDCDYHR